VKDGQWIPSEGKRKAAVIFWGGNQYMVVKKLQRDPEDGESRKRVV